MAVILAIIVMFSIPICFSYRVQEQVKDRPNHRPYETDSADYVLRPIWLASVICVLYWFLWHTECFLIWIVLYLIWRLIEYLVIKKYEKW